MSQRNSLIWRVEFNFIRLESAPMKAPCLHLLRRARQLMAWGGALVFLLAALAPGVSRLLSAPAEGARWVELCTASGTRWVEIADGAGATATASAEPVAATSEPAAPSHLAGFDHCPLCFSSPTALPLPPGAGLASPVEVRLATAPLAAVTVFRRSSAATPAQPRAPPVSA